MLVSKTSPDFTEGEGTPSLSAGRSPASFSAKIWQMGRSSALLFQLSLPKLGHSPGRGGTGWSHCRPPLHSLCASAVSLPGFLPAQAPSSAFLAGLHSNIDLKVLTLLYHVTKGKKTETLGISTVRKNFFLLLFLP